MKENNLGQSMFEILVAVFVVAISLTAVVSLATNALSNTTFSKDRTLAAKHTQDAVEWLRAERDRDWGVFLARATAGGREYCLSLLRWDASCANIEGTNLDRRVTLIISTSDPNTIEARVVTTWVDQSGTHESRVSTYFTNWRTR